MCGTSVVGWNTVRHIREDIGDGAQSESHTRKALNFPPAYLARLVLLVNLAGYSFKKLSVGEPLHRECPGDVSKIS